MILEKLVLEEMAAKPALGRDRPRARPGNAKNTEKDMSTKTHECSVLLRSRIDTNKY